jgi:hypothetical protein
VAERRCPLAEQVATETRNQVNAKPFAGRPGDDWDVMLEAGLAFLIERAKLRNLTTYTELNTVLQRRTGCRPFDFELDYDRAALGHLLGQIVHRNYPATGLIISALVKYLNENNAGPGFYDMALHYGNLKRRTPAARYDFWVAEVGRVHDHYAARDA